MEGPRQQSIQTPSARPRVIIADDHRIVAEAIEGLLSDAFDVVGVFEDGDALLEACERLQCDVMVIDVAMPRRSGLSVLKELRAKRSHVPVIFLTMHAEPAIVSAAMRAGANGYVLKAGAAKELHNALNVVLAGGSYLPASLGARHLRETGGAIQLTAKQQSILILISNGMGTKQIARHLGLSTRTVEAHRYTMMQMFRAHSAVELVRFASELGLLVAYDASSIEEG